MYYYFIIIIGQEFQAIFLSTAEPLDECGRSKNPTKSPCGQHVFNTAITRAKSLIVCAGNPFLLMEVEKKIQKTDTDKFFWKEYLRRCFVTNTFRVQNSLVKDRDIGIVMNELQKLIFTDDTKVEGHLQYSPTKNDSIIKKLEIMASQRNIYQNCKLKIMTQQGEYQNWNMVENDISAKESNTIDNNVVTDVETMECELSIKNLREAIGIPLAGSQNAIIINGF